jgi:hypothetical protein
MYSGPVKASFSDVLRFKAYACVLPYISPEIAAGPAYIFPQAALVCPNLPACVSKRCPGDHVDYFR